MNSIRPFWPKIDLNWHEIDIAVHMPRKCDPHRHLQSIGWENTAHRIGVHSKNHRQRGLALPLNSNMLSIVDISFNEHHVDRKAYNRKQFSVASRSSNIFCFRSTFNVRIFERSKLMRAMCGRTILISRRAHGSGYCTALLIHTWNCSNSS